MKKFVFENFNYDESKLEFLQDLIDWQEKYKTDCENIDKEVEDSNSLNSVKNDHNHINILPNSKIMLKYFDISIGTESHAHKCHENSMRTHLEKELPICAGVVYPILISNSRMKQYVSYKPEMGIHLGNSRRQDWNLHEKLFAWPIKNAGIHFWNIKDGAVYDTTLNARNYFYVGHEINSLAWVDPTINISEEILKKFASKMFTFWKNELLEKGVFPFFKDIKTT